MSAQHRVRVFLTVDTEFSIGGAFSDPQRYTPVGSRAVLLPSGETSEGLGFLLDALDRHRLTASFFVETCNADFFGAEPISDIIQTINLAGHDTQLHLHPCWSAFKDPQWRQRVKWEAPNDSLADCATADIVRFIREGSKIFKDAGVPAPIALRAGNLQAGNTVYAAMAQTGITVGSNIGLALYLPDDPTNRRYGGCILVDGIQELPVLSYKEINVAGYHRNKTLTIIGSTFSELKYLLGRAHRERITNVVILTHPSEFALYEQPTITNIMPNRLTQRRFEKLCVFLSRRADEFMVTDFSTAASSGIAPCDDPVLRLPLRFTASRLLGHLRQS